MGKFSNGIVIKLPLKLPFKREVVYTSVELKIAVTFCPDTATVSDGKIIFTV
jgi:hypothetical protein